MAFDLVKKFSSLHGVLEAPLEVLCQEKGLKENSAVLLKLVEFICRGNKQVKNTVKISLSEELPLFEEIETKQDEAVPVSEETKPKQRAKRAKKQTKGLFTFAVLKESIDLLPHLPDTDSLTEIRSFLVKNLHFNSLQSRERCASYINQRMFPEGYADQAIRLFARKFQGTQALRDVCFYRFLKAEPVEAQIVDEVLIPNIGSGFVERETLKNYLETHFPNSKSIKHCIVAALNALESAQVANVNKSKVTYGYREILLPSLAFILHSEFPEPGMYGIEKYEANPIIQCMLWNPDRLLPSLYDLRNNGFISKVSEIDTVRQFTTMYTLDQMVENLIQGRPSA